MSRTNTEISFTTKTFVYVPNYISTYMIKCMWVYEFKKKELMGDITKYTSMGLELKKLFCYCLHFGPLLSPEPKSHSTATLSNQPIGPKAASPSRTTAGQPKSSTNLQDKTSVNC